MNLGTMAGCLGVSPSYLSDVELGRRPPFGSGRLIRISKVLGLDDRASADLMCVAAIERGYIEIPETANSERVLSAIALLGSQPKESL
jgi:transcriptional regulator with XRE-family HTH domain